MTKKIVTEVVSKVFERAYWLGVNSNKGNPRYQTNLKKQIEKACRKLGVKS